ncbi:MAG TPA: glycosyl hydrolase [Verrucomicrobiae bacterium]|nr:glycosyl hydrolase [Verrucomicrobiae bacterium]
MLRKYCAAAVIFCSFMFAAIFIFDSSSYAQQESSRHDNPFSALKWRLVGPYRGGRVEAAAGIPGTNTYYFGSVDGGVWRSDSAGQQWAPLFDKEPVQSIGALAIAPSDPNVIYVGTGEPCLRGDISYGNGVYKSTDGGKTWTHAGLDDTQHISAIIVDPRNPDLVMVAAIGHAFGSNEARGVFRSADGGKTWTKVLYKDDQTGAGDIVFDPTNAHIVYAALYQVVRKPWDFISGGPGSGMYKSTDEGLTWKPLEGHGLPSGPLGKIGIAVGADGERVYALIEADKGGLYVSNDAGGSWGLATDNHEFRQRAWYFTHLYADPKNVNEVYVLNTGVFRSVDGGHSFQPIIGGDSHILWIDPTDSAHMIVGDDGGAAVSLDNGKSWSTRDNQPTAQFYHVATDNRFPYYVYGAQQDAGTVAIANRGNPTDFYDVGGGESGWVVPDSNGDTVYGDSYDGEITRFDHASGEVVDVSPWPLNPMGHGAANLKYRFQWTAPIASSPFDEKTIYFGGNVLFRTNDAGKRWTIISPDLTRNDKSKQQSAGGPITKDNTSVEYYDTIFVIAPSKVTRGEIWVGSDDGLVHLTRDDGAHWSDVTPKGFPEWDKISGICPSPFAAGTAYIAVSGNKLDDFHPYAYKTTDFGHSWTKITDGIPDGDYVHAVTEDPGHRGLLFAGTELGVYVSFDDGGHWQSLQSNLPHASVRDLTIHGNDLLVATHGRAFWALDDITPLRHYSESLQNDAAHLFPPAPAYRQAGGGFSFFGGGAAGATIDYWLKSEPSGDVTLEIADSHGKVIRKYSTAHHAEAPEFGGFRFGRGANLTKNAGINRFTWDLRYESSHTVPGAISWGGSPAGPMAVPGNYQVKLTVNGQSYTAPLEVKLDPRLHLTQEELDKQLALALQIQQEVNAAHDAVNQIRGLHEQLEGIQKRLGSGHKDIADSAKSLDEKSVAIENKLIQSKSKAGEDPLNYPIQLADQMMALGSSVGGAASGPTEAAYTVYNQLKGEIDAQLAAWHEVQTKDLAAFNEMMRRSDIPFVSVETPKGEGGGMRRR